MAEDGKTGAMDTVKDKVFEMFVEEFILRFRRMEHKIDRLLSLAQEIKTKEEEMSVELDQLTVQVQENEDLENSAIQLIQGIAAQLLAIKDDPVKIAALAASLKVSATGLADAIIANTPAVP